MNVVAAPYLFRGPRPRSLRDLRWMGFETLIVLETGLYEFFHDDAYESEFPSDYGMRHYNIPCSNFFPPNEYQVNKFLEIVSKHEKTYFHCKRGKDRTGFMAAVYRMRKQGWTFEQAYQEWVAMGRNPLLDWWKHSLKKWEPK